MFNNPPSISNASDFEFINFISETVEFESIRFNVSSLFEFKKVTSFKLTFELNIFIPAKYV